VAEFRLLSEESEISTDEYTFTQEYIDLATNALKMRASKEFEQAMMEPERPQNNGSGIQLIVPGGGLL
jgi:hypothetical protein